MMQHDDPLRQALSDLALNMVFYSMRISAFVPERKTLYWIIGTSILLWLMTSFIRHSAVLGVSGLIFDLSKKSPFYSADAPVINVIMFLHMVTGAFLVALAPLQVVTPLRRRWPKMHRWAGRVTIVFGIYTAFGAIVYAVFLGTTGGPFMNLSSSVYGILMILTAIPTYWYGVRKLWIQHRKWAIRFTALVIASWFYRVHYVLWDVFTDGLWTTPDMTGPFDKFQAWAFYLQYLLFAELFFLWEDRKKRMRRRLQRAQLREA